MENQEKESICRNPRIEEGRLVCDKDVVEEKTEETKKPVPKKESKEKCDVLYDSSTKQKLQVCTQNGKPSSAKLMVGDFSKEEEL